MKRNLLIGLLLATFVLPIGLQAGAHEDNRLGISFVLSGHLFFGLKVQHFFDDHNAVQVTFFPLVVPAKKFPFAWSAGYQYYGAGKHWQGNIGAQFAMIVSPPDPQRRKILPMLNITPGLRYVRENGQTIGGNIWLSYFLKKTRRRFFPTGLEFFYDFSW